MKSMELQTIEQIKRKFSLQFPRPEKVHVLGKVCKVLTYSGIAPNTWNTAMYAVYYTVSDKCLRTFGSGYETRDNAICNAYM